MPSGLQFVTSVDQSAYDRALLRFVEELGLDSKKVVTIAARQLYQELLKFTAPRSQAQGRKAVGRDISRAAWAIDPAKIYNPILRQAIQDQEFDVVRAFLMNSRNKGGLLSLYHLEHFSPELHRRARDSRGRVQRSKHVIVLERQEHARYVRLVRGHVGSTKFAWGVGLQTLGATVPGWIMKHHPELAQVEDERSTPHAPSIAVTNKGPGIGNLEASIIKSAVDRRTRAMNRDVDQVLAGRASKYFK